MSELPKTHTKIEVRKSSQAVTIVERTYDEDGWEVNAADSRMGVINFDDEVTTKDEVFKRAKTRKWGFSDEPLNPTRNPNMYAPIDLGPLETEERQEVLETPRETETE